MSVLTGAAAGRQPSLKEERKYHKTVAAINLRKLLRAFTYMELYSPSEAEELEKALEKLALQIPEQWRDEDWPLAAKHALDRLFGDPMQKDSLKLRQYAIPYWNPTAKTVNIHPLGLRDEDGKELASVAPQGIVGIPATYTTGGKYSTVYGVAPQLKPLPTPARSKDSVYGDHLAPASYVEWISFCSINITDCCKAPYMWSDTKQVLVCNKCRGKHARRVDKREYQGFVPAHIPCSQAQCAFYHCALPRWGGRRWCKMHSKQYDKEAEKTECTILTL